jgi:ribonuclease J
MRKNFNIASNLGIANAPDGLLIQPREIEDHPDEEVIAISTGSQGEPLSALRRMAHGEHRDVELHSGDTVVFSATPVPGNERSVNETVDRIFEIGARVITAADAPIHASGHGYQEDMKLMLNLTRPRYVMPVHGDYKRIRLHAELAESIGIDSERIFRSRNGVPLEIDGDGARLGDDLGAGMIFVDGLELGEPDDAALRDRRTLSADGLVIVVATVSLEDGEVAADPEISFRGVPMPSNESTERLVDELMDVVEDKLEDGLRGHVREPALIRQDLHDAVAAFVYKRLKRRPMVLPVVIEV